MRNDVAFSCLDCSRLRSIAVDCSRIGYAVALSFALCAAHAAEFVLQKNGRMPAAQLHIPAPPLPPPEGAISLAFDSHGNHWALGPVIGKGERRALVLPAQDQSGWIADELSGIRPGPWHWLIADEFGFVWISDGNRVLRLDPHAPGTGWQDISADSAFPEGQVTAMAIGPAGSVLAAFKEGGIAELDRIRLNRRRRESNVVRVIDAPADIRELRADNAGNVWAKARGKVYRLDAPEDAWQRHWEVVARMPGGSHDLSGDVLNGKFYMDWAISGGFGYPSTGRFHSTLLEFDPATSRWRIAANYGLPRGYCAVGTLADEVWTVAGAALDKDGQRYSPTLTQICAPIPGVLRTGSDLPVAIPAAIGLSAGDRLYVLGFPEGKDQALKLFSIGTDEDIWTSEPDGPVGSGSSYGTEMDGKLYTVVPHKCMAIFDTATKTWATTEAPHSPRSPAVGHYRSEIWVMGGRTNEGGSVTYIYNPGSGQWRKGPDLPREIVWGCAFNIDAALYLTGGAAGRCYSNRTFRLRDWSVAVPPEAVQSPD